MYYGINANNFKLVLASLHMHMHRSAHTLSLSLHARTTNKPKKKARGAGFSLLFPLLIKVRFLFVARKPRKWMYVLRLQMIALCRYIHKFKSMIACWFSGVLTVIYRFMRLRTLRVVNMKHRFFFFFFSSSFLFLNLPDTLRATDYTKSFALHLLNPTLWIL